MKKISALVSILLVFFCSCTQTESYKKPDDPLVAGSDFIKSALEGNMVKAKLFILNDEANNRLFKKFEENYNKTPAAEKAAYKEASTSIHVNKFQNLNDSTAILNYSNSYKKENSEIKLVKVEGEWWVDFKYTFIGDTSQK
jgi:hypothetical protein